MNLKKLLGLISTKDITFNSSVNKEFKIQAENRFNIYNFNNFINLIEITQFLETLESDRVYVIIPLISKTNNSSDPWLILSKMVLITKHSNSELIYNYLNKQWLKAQDDFRMEPYHLQFNIKYRPVTFTTKVNK